MRLLSVAPTNECEWNMLATEVPPKVSMVLFPIQDIPHTDTYTNALTQMHAYDCTVYMHARSSYYSFGQIYTEQTFTRHDTKTNKTKIILDRSQNHFSFVCLLCVWVKEGLKQKKGRRSREPNRDAENKKKKNDRLRGFILLLHNSRTNVANKFLAGAKPHTAGYYGQVDVIAYMVYVCCSIGANELMRLTLEKRMCCHCAAIMGCCVNDILWCVRSIFIRQHRSWPQLHLCVLLSLSLSISL